MVKKIMNLPESIMGFVLQDTTKDDFMENILPEVKDKTILNRGLHFLYVLESDPSDDFTLWFEDAIRRIQKRCSWNRTAFITDCDLLANHVRNFQRFMIGDFKVFRKSQQMEAISWLRS